MTGHAYKAAATARTAPKIPPILPTLAAEAAPVKMMGDDDVGLTPPVLATPVPDTVTVVLDLWCDECAEERELLWTVTEETVAEETTLVTVAVVEATVVVTTEVVLTELVLTELEELLGAGTDVVAGAVLVEATAVASQAQTAWAEEIIVPNSVLGQEVVTQVKAADWMPFWFLQMQE